MVFGIILNLVDDVDYSLYDNDEYHSLNDDFVNLSLGAFELPIHTQCNNKFLVILSALVIMWTNPLVHLTHTCPFILLLDPPTMGLI